MIDKAVCYVKGIVLYTDHISDLKQCKNEIQQLKIEVAALRAVQDILQGAIEVKMKGENQ